MISDYSIENIRSQIVGSNVAFKTPFGKRNIFYADYTASGRGLLFIEKKMLHIMKAYGNSHTEDDYTGIRTTHLLHQAEEKIKSLVNAGPDGRIILTGYGATGALERLQKIIGIYQSPMNRERIFRIYEKQGKDNSLALFRKAIEKFRPVVFIGPYEHHSNELMWRESIAEVVVIQLNRSGKIDLKDLEARLSNPEYASRERFVSISAGSNVTGQQSDIYEIARICHHNNTPVFFDFAAVAPYEEINMNRDKESYFDAIFFSPHKFLGGPGASGVLVFNEKLYQQNLPPTTAGGGTVDYVGFSGHDFSREIETREKPGTPGILQSIKAALVMELKEKIGVQQIKQIEERNMDLFFSELKDESFITFLGGPDLTDRIPIISFNIRHEDRILHPKFVTKILNDLFGIQTRAGCSCAGPYGHILLDISDELSQKYRKLISGGFHGMKPGWVRINLHYTFSEEDVRFLTRAIKFVARNGYLFLQKYVFYIHTGEWRFEGFKGQEIEFGLDNDFDTETVNIKNIPSLRESYFREAEEWAERLRGKKSPHFKKDETSIEELKYFYYIHVDRSAPCHLSCCTV